MKQTYFSRNKNAKGFTIVELLIVIVVIGILAGLVLNTFNGIQQRARNTTRIDTVKKYITALQLYAADNSSYPTNDASQTYFSTCLGDGYRDYNSDGTGDCRFVNNSSQRVSEDDTFKDALRPYFGEVLEPV